MIGALLGIGGMMRTGNGLMLAAIAGVVAMVLLWDGRRINDAEERGANKAVEKVKTANDTATKTARKAARKSGRRAPRGVCPVGYIEC